MKYTEIPIRVEGSDEHAKLMAYILDTPSENILTKKRPLVLICPGGAYEKLSYREGEPLAIHFMNQGYHACVLHYSLAPTRYPVQLLELATAMKIINEHAREWKIDTEHIVLQGSSAGAHLAGMLGVFWNQDWVSEAVKAEKIQLKPAGLMLSYPVITSEEKYRTKSSFKNLLGERFEKLKDEISLEKQVTKDTPPCFIWHTLEDKSVPVENAFLMVSALKKAGIPAELHVFPEGEHGLSLASPLVQREDGSGIQKQCQAWIGLADTWMERLLKK